MLKRRQLVDGLQQNFYSASFFSPKKWYDTHKFNWKKTAVQKLCNNDFENWFKYGLFIQQQKKKSNQKEKKIGIKMTDS